MLKTLIKWCNAEEDQQTCELTYQRMLTQLAGIEWNMTKSRLAASMNEAELENYSQLHKKVEAGITEAKEEIEAIVAQFESMVREEVHVDSRTHPMIIGRRGQGIRKIMQEYKVDIKMPRQGVDPDPDLVIVSYSKKSSFH